MITRIGAPRSLKVCVRNVEFQSAQLAMEYGKLLRQLQEGETAGYPVDLNKYSFHSIDLERKEMPFIKKDTVEKEMKEKILGNPSQRYVIKGGKVLTIYRQSFVLGGLYSLYLFIYCPQCRYMIIYYFNSFLQSRSCRA